MARIRRAARPSAELVSLRRQNPSRTSKSQITQLTEPSTSSELSSEEGLTDNHALGCPESGAKHENLAVGPVESTTASTIQARETPDSVRHRTLRPRKDTRSTNLGLLRDEKERKASSKRKRIGHESNRPNPRRRPRRSPRQERETIAQPSSAPDWKDPRIPIECWSDIFYYAASDSPPGSLAINWLLQVATSCRFFTEPALDTLYRYPKIQHISKAKKLLNLLELPVAKTKLNYRSKIETLHLNIHLVPASIMYRLIHPLPRLRELIIYTEYDQPPYRELERGIRWHYPAEIFQALLPGAKSVTEATLKPYHTQLKSWEWSGRLIGGYVDGLKDISRIHELPSFATLTRVSFTNFQTPSLLKRLPKNDEEAAQFFNEDNAHIELIAASITKLPALSHLVFESSTVMNDHMLSLLPTGLLHLELINCWEIRSFDLAAFLRDKGGEMRILSLHHNQSLDLGFLTDLADTCPKLRELDMNLSYYKLYDSGNDADPMYDQALLPDQVPRWPPSIRVINLEHIRDWSVEAAEMFLQTLINNAHNLPNLRHLSVKTMLDIPWQSRASMRTTWRNKMERVFLRPSPLPPREYRTHQPTIEGPTTSSKDIILTPTPPSRRSIRIAEHGTSSHGTHRSSRRNCRNSERHNSYRDPNTDEDELSDFESSEYGVSSNGNDFASSGSPHQVHGLCKTVNLVFDNQKVRELQYGMEDFQTDNDGLEDDEWDGDYDSDDPVLQF